MVINKVLFSVLRTNKPPKIFFFKFRDLSRHLDDFFAISPEFLGQYFLLETMRFPMDFWFSSNWKYSKRRFFPHSLPGFLVHVLAGISIYRGA